MDESGNGKSTGETNEPRTRAESGRPEEIDTRPLLPIRARPVDIVVRKPGRPTLFSEAVTEEVCRHITRGVPVVTAARAAGISKRTFNDWLVRGAEGEEPYEHFYEAVERARAEFVAVHVNVIHEAGQLGKQWQASAWLLERRIAAFRKREKTESKVEHSGNVRVVLTVPNNGRGRE